jgi:hypothetical protein
VDESAVSLKECDQGLCVFDLGEQGRVQQDPLLQPLLLLGLELVEVVLKSFLLQ